MVDSSSRRRSGPAGTATPQAAEPAKPSLPAPAAAAAHDPPQARLRARTSPPSTTDTASETSAEGPALDGQGGRQWTLPLTSSFGEESPLPGAASADELGARLRQFYLIQEFFHNLQGVDLGNDPIETTTSPEDTMRRLSEVTYQLDVLKALQAVLTEEMKQLQQALTGKSEDPEAPHR
jgi:hypothetical protein